MSRSGSMKRAPAKATLILHPPDREEVVEFCMSSENCRPVIKKAVRKWRGGWVNKSEDKCIQRQMRGEGLIRYGRSSQKNLVVRIVRMNSIKCSPDKILAALLSAVCAPISDILSYTSVS